MQHVPVRQILLLNVAGETFGVGISLIREIIELGRLARVPLMPAFVRGVVNLRGQVVPVIDLVARLETGAAALRTRRHGVGGVSTGRRSCVIVVDLPDSDPQQPSQVYGLLVDGVSEVVDVADDAIAGAPEFGTGLRADFVEGVARIPESSRQRRDAQAFRAQTHEQRQAESLDPIDPPAAAAPTSGPAAPASAESAAEGRDRFVVLLDLLCILDARELAQLAEASCLAAEVG